MKIVVLFALFFSLTQTACAKPNYQDLKTVRLNEKPAAQVCALSFKTENLCASQTWIAKPTEDDTGSFTLKFWSATTGEAADPAMNVKVIIWMSDMGHGSSPVTITKQATGQYLVDRVFFSMHGNWQIRVQIKNAQAIAEEQIINVTF